MYEVRVSGDTPISKVRLCLKELEAKTLWCSFDIKNSTIRVDGVHSNPDDVMGTVISKIGIDNIDWFGDPSMA